MGGRREKVWEKEAGKKGEEDSSGGGGGGGGSKDMITYFIHAGCIPPFCCTNIPSMSGCCLENR